MSGMFNTVVVDWEIPCRKCGMTLTDFQSKDGEYSNSILPVKQVQRFYSACLCGAWNEFKVIPLQVMITHDDEAELAADYRAKRSLERFDNAK